MAAIRIFDLITATQYCGRSVCPVYQFRGEMYTVGHSG